MNGTIKEYNIENGNVTRMTLQCAENDFEIFKIIAATKLQEKYGKRLDFSNTKFFLEPNT